MHIAIVGATGFIGSRIVTEAVNRGHLVTAISRNPGKLPKHDCIIAAAADVHDVGALAANFRGKDAVIHSFKPANDLSSEGKKEQQRDGTRSIIAAMKAAGVRRILAVGGAGALEIRPGVPHYETPEFPAAVQGGARATALIRELLLAEQNLAWTFLCPSSFIRAGERTGKFRLGGDALLVGADGQSRISVEDYAVAMIDELENPRHTGRRFTVGY